MRTLVDSLIIWSEGAQNFQSRHLLYKRPNPCDLAEGTSGLYVGKHISWSSPNPQGLWCNLEQYSWCFTFSMFWGIFSGGKKDSPPLLIRRNFWLYFFLPISLWKFLVKYHRKKNIFLPFSISSRNREYYI